jgi:multiple sugar transport system permease protein
MTTGREQTVHTNAEGGDTGRHEAKRTRQAPSRASKGKLRRRLGSAAAFLALSAYTVFALFPLFWIFLTSIKRPADVIAVPPKFIFEPTFANYADVLSRPEFLEPFKNSIIVTLGSLAVTLILGLPAAYALARIDFRGKEDMAFAFLSLRFAPELIVILPLFIIYQQLSLYDTYLGLIIVYQLITFPLMVWMMRSFFEDVPKEIEEAVQIDGGTWWTSFRMIAGRIALPGVAATSVLVFIYAWNNFIFALVLASRDTQVITGGLLQFISFNQIEWGSMAAGVMLTIVPEFIVAVFALRYMIRGLTAGTVKG